MDNVIAHLWEFADDFISTEWEPTQVFTEAGSYNVIYTATDYCGNTGTAATTVTISDVQGAVPPDISFAPIDDCPASYTFTINNNAGAETHYWDFGDGTPLVELDGIEETTHHFAEVGDHTVYYAAAFELRSSSNQ